METPQQSEFKKPCFVCGDEASDQGNQYLPPLCPDDRAEFVKYMPLPPVRGGMEIIRTVQVKTYDEEGIPGTRIYDTGTIQSPTDNVVVRIDLGTFHVRILLWLPKLRELDAIGYPMRRVLSWNDF